MNISPEFLLGIIALHFCMLIAISLFTSKGASNNSFFIADRNAHWFLVAYGMIGTAISGVTFMSVPGNVGTEGVNKAFSYLQFVMGNMVGYLIVATVLLPLYYRMNLISIYGYLKQRLGHFSYKTGAGFFLVSRLIGAAFRLYLMALVMHKFVIEPFGVPFWVTALLVPALIWVYTFKGGTKTIIITDTIQTTFFVLALILTLFSIAGALNTDLFGLLGKVQESKYSQIFFFENGWSDPNNFFKQFLGGLVITIAMFGLDQDMMQKNLACKNIRDAQKNMFTFSLVFFLVVSLFVLLGAAMYLLVEAKGITLPPKSDQLFALLAFNHLGYVIGIAFMMGLVASSYASGDSALASLTTSFCVDFLNFEEKQADAAENAQMEKGLDRTRILVHLGFTAALALCILIFAAQTDQSVVNLIFKIANYTYGPLLGLFFFGLLTKRKVKDELVPFIGIFSAITTYFIDTNSKTLFNGFEFGFLAILLNAGLTYFGLMLSGLLIEEK